MKNSLKLMMVAFCALFMAGQANAVQYLEDKYSGIHMLSDNQHVFTFIPRDIKGIQGNTTRAIYKCDEHGNELVTGSSKPARSQQIEKRYGVSKSETCATFYSKSTDTSWVIAFVPSYGGVSARARQIHKLKDGQFRLWATFNPKDHDRNIYASTGAQKFAGRNGDRNTDVARSPDEPENNEVAQAPHPAKENCAGKNFFEKAACELKNAGVENAVGTIINKSR